jgi:DNA polymerase-4
LKEFWGVGKKTAEQLHKLNVKTVRDLRQLKSIGRETTFATDIADRDVLETTL